MAEDTPPPAGDVAERPKLKITVTPSGKLPPSPPEGDINRPEGPADKFGTTGDTKAPTLAPGQPEPGAGDAAAGATGDDAEPSLRRSRGERADFETFARAVRAAGQDPFSAVVGMLGADTLGDNRTAEAIAQQVAELKAARGLSVSPGAVVSDIARGAVEAPRQMLGGVRDAAQAAIDGIGSLGDWLNAHVDLGTPQVWDDKGNFAPGLVPSAAKTEMPQLPGVKRANTVTGGIVRNVSQFLAGFAGAGKLLGAAAPGGLAGAAVKGAVADFGAFEGHEARLADLVQQVPALRNPVAAYLASSGDDGDLEGRFKRAAEGLGLGALTQGLLLALRAIKAARAARAAADPQAQANAAAEAARQETRPAAKLDLLGVADPSLPLVELAAAKGRKAVKATGDLGVPTDVAAKAMTDRGLTPLGKNTGVYVNFARINTADDVKRVLSDVAEAFKGDIDKARRGVQTNADTVRQAATVDAWEVMLARRKGEPLNAEQTLALRQLWEASARKLTDVAGAAAAIPSPENLFQFRKMLATHYAIQAEAIAVRTETARALQSWAIPAGGSREQMRAIEDTISRYGGLSVNAEFAARIAALKNVPGGPLALDNLVQKGVFTKTLDVLKEVWINALLSGPKTHIVNTMSNTAVAGQQIAERYAAARLSQIFGSGDVPIGEAAAQWFGLTQGIREAFKNTAIAFKTGHSGSGIGKWELPHERAISSGRMGVPAGPWADSANWLGNGVDALGTMVTLPGRFLTAADEFWKSIGYRMELHAQAFRAASREVTDGQIPASAMKSRMADIVANPPENIRMAGVDAAAYQTFTNEPGSWVKAISRLEHDLNERSVAGQLGGLLLRFTIPFRNTPANIMKYTFERTPLAPLMERYRDASARGGADADIARTRMALGTMTMMTAMDLAFDGHITGSGPDTEERGKRDTLYRSGWQPYSFKVGDRYFSYSRLDPIGYTFGLGADLAEIVNSADPNNRTSLEIQKAFTASVFAAGNNILSKSYLRGMSDLIHAVTGTNRQGSAYFERMASSFVPATSRDLARAVDPYFRATNDILSALKNRVPGLSGDLPLLRDVWGRPKSMISGLGNAFDVLSPVYSREFKPEPIDQEMLDQGWNLSMPGKRYGELKMTNRPDQYSRFLELRGQTSAGNLDPALAQKYGDHTLLQVLNGLVTGAHPLSGAYEKLPKGEERRDFAKKIVAAFGRAARDRLKKDIKGGAADDGDDED